MHTNYDENFKWVESLCSKKYQRDILVVAGDVSDDLAILRRALLENTIRTIGILVLTTVYSLINFANPRVEMGFEKIQSMLAQFMCVSYFELGFLFVWIVCRKTLSSLVSKFKHVAFVPGNHELWVSCEMLVLYSMHMPMQLFRYVVDLSERAYANTLAT